MAVKKVFLINQLPSVNIPSGLHPMGAYNNGTDYAVGDSVDYNGSSYVMYVDAPAGTLPTDTTKWQVLANIGPQGATGTQGPQGSTGAQGPQGSVGPQGTTGSQGTTGAQGPQGNSGAQGTTGAQGPQGTTGTTGSQGPQGNTGSQGPQGTTGVQGPQGAQGATGADSSVQGPQGTTGATGPQGASGSQGATGSQGSTGAQGPQGTTGSQGNQGAQGTTGNTGPQGPQGTTGSTGAQGPQGETGAQGPQGPQGNTGSQGDTGAQGPQGNTGTQGPQGTTGTQGPQGATGATGAMAAQMNSNFSTNTSAPPADKGIKYNNGTPASVTAIYLDETDVNGSDLSSLVNQFSAGDLLEITSQSNPNIFHTFIVTSNTDNGDYHTIGVTWLAGNPSTIDNGTVVAIIHSDIGPTGPQGTAGAQGPQGSTGTQGPQGTAGAQGPQGTAGTQGNQGTQGTTGTQGPQGATGTFANPMTAEVDMGENAGFALDTALSADGKYSGIVEAGTAGATLAFGDLCYLQTSDSRWELTDANLSAGYGMKLGMCVLAAAADGSATKMLLFGKIRADAKFPTFTIGAPVYMSETAGLVTSTAPVTTDAAIRIVGFSNTGDELHFCPDNSYYTHV